MKCPDRFRGKRFALYDTQEIASYFRTIPGEFVTKRGWELEVGRVLANCSDQIRGENPKIGFMMKGVYAESAEAERPSLQRIFREDMVEDQDFDIFLQYRKSCSIVQITRFEEHRAGSDANSGLLQLIKKKLLIQPDELLQLVVIADFTFDLHLENLNRQLNSLSVPYKRIFLIAQAGE